MKIHELEGMHPRRRRRFLKWMAAALTGATISEDLRLACLEVAGGKAYAQGIASSRPTYFIELNLRDQWDNGHVFVAPSLVPKLDQFQKGASNELTAIFLGQADVKASAAHRAYLSPQSSALEPHLDHIAMIDACNPSMGVIHGHEAANPIRSPGRAYQATGRSPMWNNDPVSTTNLQGCEPFYSTTPTPASLHNHYQHTLTTGLRNGIAFKGISRSIHTAYHFGAGLDGAELDRVPSKDELYRKFPDTIQDVNILASSEEADAFRRILERTDKRFLERLRYRQSTVQNHVGNLARAREVLYVNEPRVVSMPLTLEEIAYWSEGVPAQKCTVNDTQIVDCGEGGAVKGQIWEQMAFAYKLLASGLTRTAALEFDFMDLHNYRPAFSLETMAVQLSIPLARLMQKLKETPDPNGSGMMFERTLLAAYTTDGSRSPMANSYGDSGNAKNTLLLAGGMIKGGYYGDISWNGGGDFATHAPDPTTGAPMARGTRVADADAWRTVMKALDIPDTLAGSFPDVKSGETPVVPSA